MNCERDCQRIANFCETDARLRQMIDENNFQKTHIAELVKDNLHSRGIAESLPQSSDKYEVMRPLSDAEFYQQQAAAAIEEARVELENALRLNVEAMQLTLDVCAMSAVSDQELGADRCPLDFE